jgi:hypothetical protein
MFTKDSKSFAGLFGKSLSKGIKGGEQIRGLGHSATEHLNRANIAKSRRDPIGAANEIRKSCWYLESMIDSLQTTTGVVLTKSAEQSNAVRDRIDSASDWINTADEKNIYDVVDECSTALKTAISALTMFSEAVSDDETFNKDRFATLDEGSIYKAWKHVDNTWWDHDPKTNQIIPVDAPGGGGNNADVGQAKQGSDSQGAQKKSSGTDSKASGGDSGGKDDSKDGQIKQPKSPNQITLSKEQLNTVLSDGFYSVISAGRNPNNADEANLDPTDPKFKERHEQLRQDLDKLGFKYTEVVGHYGGEEPSFLVFHEEPEAFQDTDKNQIAFFITHEDEKSQPGLNALGKKYNQDSVLHGAKGRNELHFTSGKFEGKTCGGNGHQELPEAEDYFTSVPVAGKAHSKVQMDISECFNPGAPFGSQSE